VLRRERHAPSKPFAQVQAARFSAVGADLAPLPDAAPDVTFAEALATATSSRRRMVVREFELAASEEPQ
jgi:hypothetical protein